MSDNRLTRRLDKIGRMRWLRVPNTQGVKSRLKTEGKHFKNYLKDSYVPDLRIAEHKVKLRQKSGLGNKLKVGGKWAVNHGHSLQNVVEPLVAAVNTKNAIKKAVERKNGRKPKKGEKGLGSDLGNIYGGLAGGIAAQHSIGRGLMQAGKAGRIGRIASKAGRYKVPIGIIGGLAGSIAGAAYGEKKGDNLDRKFGKKTKRRSFASSELKRNAEAIGLAGAVSAGAGSGVIAAKTINRKSAKRLGKNLDPKSFVKTLRKNGITGDIASAGFSLRKTRLVKVASKLPKAKIAPYALAGAAIGGTIMTTVVARKKKVNHRAFASGDGPGMGMKKRRPSMKQRASAGAAKVRTGASNLKSSVSKKANQIRGRFGRKALPENSGLVSSNPKAGNVTNTQRRKMGMGQKFKRAIKGKPKRVLMQNTQQVSSNPGGGRLKAERFKVNKPKAAKLSVGRALNDTSKAVKKAGGSIGRAAKYSGQGAGMKTGAAKRVMRMAARGELSAAKTALRSVPKGVKLGAAGTLGAAAIGGGAALYNSRKKAKNRK